MYVAYVDEKKKTLLLGQLELNDLVRNLSLSKKKSRVTEFKTTATESKVSSFRNRSAKLSSFYKFEDRVCHCPSVPALMVELGTYHVAKKWRLFIDSSKASLKALLLHNGIEKPSILLAHAVGMTETYDSNKLILDLIGYKRYKWNICSDLEVILLVLGYS